MHDAHDRVDDVDDGIWQQLHLWRCASRRGESGKVLTQSVVHCVCRGMSEITWLMRGHPHHPTRHAVFNIWIHARTKGVLVAVGHALAASVGIVAHIRSSRGYPLPTINAGALFPWIPRKLLYYVV